MMTLMARLCTLCALTAMIQMALGENDAKGSMRMIGGLLMLHLTLEGARDLWEALSQAARMKTDREDRLRRSTERINEIEGRARRGGLVQENQGGAHAAGASAAAPCVFDDRLLRPSGRSGRGGQA